MISQVTAAFGLSSFIRRNRKRPGTSHRGFVRSFGQRQKKSGRLGKKLYLEGDLLAEAEKMQQSAMEVDERVGMVEEYLNTMLPDDWDSMDLFQRRNYLSGSEFMRLKNFARRSAMRKYGASALTNLCRS